MFLQERYEVLDCIKYDKGLAGDGNHNDIWTTYRTQVTRGEEYTTISETTSGSDGVCYFTLPTSSNIRFEFDIYQVDGTANNFFYNLSQEGTYLNGSAVGTLSKNVGEWLHIIIDLPPTGNYHLISYEGLSTPIQRSMTWDRSKSITFNLWTPSTTTSLRIKNFKVYPN